MEIYCQNHPNFNYEECKALYDKYKRQIGSEDDFNEVLKDTHFYSFYEDGKFIGCIYFYLIDGKIYVNAFAGRHTHRINLDCFRKSLTFYNCDIYAISTRKTAILCLLRCGFKKIGNNLYKYERGK